MNAKSEVSEKQKHSKCVIMQTQDVPSTVRRISHVLVSQIRMAGDDPVVADIPPVLFVAMTLHVYGCGGLPSSS